MSKNVLVIGGLFVIIVIVGAAFLLSPIEPGEPTGMFYQTPLGVKYLQVFVSSNTYTGNFGGLDGADTECQMLANNAGIDGWFNAFLSGQNNLRSRVLTTDMAYSDVNGMVVADDFEALVGLDLKRVVRVTETGENVDDYTEVWTGTLPGGVKSENYCSNWASSSELVSGSYGQTSWTDSGWMDFGVATCDNDLRIYCIEVFQK